MGKKACNKKVISEAVRSVSPLFDIDKVYLFGSFASGKDTEQSDIDLCLETGDSFSLINAAQFSNKIKEATGRDVGVVTQRCLYDHVKESMLLNRGLLYERQYV